MRELRVVEIRVSRRESSPLVVLAEVGGEERLLPIWMSHSGASAIFGATEDPDERRPNVYDLAWRLVEAAGEPLRCARIIGYDDGQFYAELVLSCQSIPARPSDAIAIALRTGCPIECADEVLDEAGIEAGDALPEAGAEGADEEVERFREFLDSVNPDDFTGEAD